MALRDDEAESLAGRIMAAADAVSPIPPVTDARPGFGLADAYRVSARIVARRVARGEHPVGWKIGFTNRTIWDEYGVHAPIWGPMYDTTLEHVDPQQGEIACPLAGLLEPRLEPEIALSMGRTPNPEMDERELLDCVDAVAHGFELVQSVFPGWRFKAADTVAAFALHGRYRCGPLVPIGTDDRDGWFRRLAEFAIRLFGNGAEVDRGTAENVLGGPLFALRHLVRGLAEHPTGRGIEPGDLVTTGTITRAFPVASGEHWRTEVEGLPTPGLRVAFT